MIDIAGKFLRSRQTLRPDGQRDNSTLLVAKYKTVDQLEFYP